MAWRIVKQPDGRYARFSDVVDNFTHLNMTREEALVVCREHADALWAGEKVRNADSDTLEDGACGGGLDRWRDSMQTVLDIHGWGGVNEVFRLMYREEG